MAAKKQTYTLIPPSQYSEPQAVINSNRVLINAKTDCILMFSKQAIGFSTAGSLHFNSDGVAIINSPKIQLGLDAKEPLLLGDQTTQFLRELLEVLNKVAEGLYNANAHVGDAKYPLYDLNAPGADLKLKTEDLLARLDQLKSKQNFTV